MTTTVISRSTAPSRKPPSDLTSMAGRRIRKDVAWRLVRENHRKTCSSRRHRIDRPDRAQSCPASTQVQAPCASSTGAHAVAIGDRFDSPSGPSGLGRALRQRQPRRPARMRDRTERGPDQDRTSGRPCQSFACPATPARRSLSCSCLSDSICRPARNSRSMTARQSTCRSRPAKTEAATRALPVTPELLTALKSGKQLKVLFQNLAKETITIPMPLTDFATAYDKIK